MRERFIELTSPFYIYFIIYYLIVNFIYLITTVLGCYSCYKRQRKLAQEDFAPILRSNTLPEMTFVVAAYNEEQMIVQMVENLLNLSYPYKHVMVVNDGSTDKTFNLLCARFSLIKTPREYVKQIASKEIRGIYQSKAHPCLIVVDKENGEKFDALNVALNLLETEYFITCDADTYVDDEYFLSVLHPFLSTHDCIGMGGAVYINNGAKLNYNRVSTEFCCENYAATMQSIEYIHAFLGREGWDYLGGNSVVSGAFAMFRTKAVIQSGGFSSTVANDMEIVLRLNRVMLKTNTPYKISYVPDPVAWTEGPTTLKGLGHQRMLWQRGTLESLWFHKVMFFNPKYKKYGLLIYPFMVIGEALEPIFEAIAYIYLIIGLFLHAFRLEQLLLLLGIIWAFNFALTLASLLTEEVSFKKYSHSRQFWILLSYSFVELLGYRQLNLWWRLLGIKNFLKRFPQVHKDCRHVNKLVKEAVKNGRIKW